MNNFEKFLLVVFILIIGIPIGQAIMNFFEISPALYMPYMAWLILILIFFAILPPKVGTMFQ